MADGAQYHGLNELNGHLRGMIHKLRAWDLFACIKGKKSGGDGLENGGPGHDVEGIQ